MSWSDDDESEDEANVETANVVTALVGRWETNEEFYDENNLYEDLDVFYKEPCVRCEENYKREEN